jgi:uncharacterized protein (DUF1919 family)
MQYLIKLQKRILKFKRRRWIERCKQTIRNENFTIISSNCWGGSIYQILDREYLTPTVGLFLYAPCFVKFTSKLRYYLNQPLHFVETSKYCKANTIRNKDGWYPIALLDDIEIHFLHYKNEEEASTKWYRRCVRINFDNLFFSMTDRDGCSEDHIRIFNELPYKNKICFTANDMRKKYACTVWLKKYAGQPYVGVLTTALNGQREVRKRFDIIQWLNDSK